MNDKLTELNWQLTIVRNYTERLNLIYNNQQPTTTECARTADILATIESAAYAARILVTQISTYPRPSNAALSRVPLGRVQ